MRGQGFRKLLVALTIIAVAAAVELNQYQADVLKVVAVAMLGANAVIHGARAISDAYKSRNGNGGAGNSGSARD